MPLELLKINEKSRKKSLLLSFIFEENKRVWSSKKLEGSLGLVSKKPQLGVAWRRFASRVIYTFLCDFFYCFYQLLSLKIYQGKTVYQRVLAEVGFEPTTFGLWARRDKPHLFSTEKCLDKWFAPCLSLLLFFLVFTREATPCVVS